MTSGIPSQFMNVRELYILFTDEVVYFFCSKSVLTIDVINSKRCNQYKKNGYWNKLIRGKVNPLENVGE